MSRVFRALEKAEKEKEERSKKDVPLRVVEEAPVIEKAQAPQPAREEKPELPRPLVQNGVPPLFAPFDSFSSEQFRRLKTQIFHWKPTPPHTVLITSSLPGEGKTLVACNLAMAISQEINRKAMLIDADLRKPSIRLSGYRHIKGLSNYLTDRTPLAEILIRHEENFWFIPAGPASRRSTELIGTRKMSELLSSLREFGDETIIIIDSSPILSTSDPVLLSKMVDAVVMVVMADQTPRETVRRAIQSIDGEKILGIVFNQKYLKASSYYARDYYGKHYHGHDRKTK